MQTTTKRRVDDGESVFHALRDLAHVISLVESTFVVPIKVRVMVIIKTLLTWFGGGNDQN